MRSRRAGATRLVGPPPRARFAALAFAVLTLGVSVFLDVEMAEHGTGSITGALALLVAFNTLMTALVNAMALTSPLWVWHIWHTGVSAAGERLIVRTLFRTHVLERSDILGVEVKPVNFMGQPYSQIVGLARTDGSHVQLAAGNVGLSDPHLAGSVAALQEWLGHPITGWRPPVTGRTPRPEARAAARRFAVIGLGFAVAAIVFAALAVASSPSGWRFAIPGLILLPMLIGMNVCTLVGRKRR